MIGSIIEERREGDDLIVTSRFYRLDGQTVHYNFSNKRSRSGATISNAHGRDTWSPGDIGYEDALARAKAAIAANLSKS